MNTREIVLATDFSPASEPASRVAREMALGSRARLHVVHVVPPVTDPTLAGPLLARETARLGAGLTMASAILNGRPARQIGAYAREHGADLIVLGTHGRTGFSRRLLGSVAEAVVRTSGCLVLTVPSNYRGALEAEPFAAPVAVPPGQAEIEECCIVCHGTADELICVECRALIRGEALEQKLSIERAGRRGAPA